MPEAPARSDPLALEATALRYAARDLLPADAEAFETRLAGDQTARDALAEAVRLSAAAIGREVPAPDRSFRALIRDRLRPVGAWAPGWLARRAYRGHPIAWAGLGAGVVAAATLVGLSLAGGETGVPAADHAGGQTVAAALPAPPPQPDGPLVVVHAPAPPAGDAAAQVAIGEPPAAAACGTDDMSLKAAEIWAELSTPDHVEKTHDDDARWRQRMRDLHSAHAGYPHPGRPATAVDAHDP